MSAYFLFDNLEVSDLEGLEDYKRRVAPVVEQFGGRYVVIGGPVVRVEGDWEPVFPVMIEFDTAERARAWYESDAYRELKAQRLSATRSNGVLLVGQPPRPATALTDAGASQ